MTVETEGMPERAWEPCEMNRQEPQWVFEPARSSPWEPCGGDPTGPLRRDHPIAPWEPCI